MTIGFCRFRRSPVSATQKFARKGLLGLLAIFGSAAFENISDGLGQGQRESKAQDETLPAILPSLL